jgi:dTDP-glucose pyrophosphorylase
MWGVIPAAGHGSRIQPLAFSKELLPVGTAWVAGVERPCAVSEYLVERMVEAGADKLAFVVRPGKTDILNYYGAGYDQATAVYVVQPYPAGLCDAMFRAAPLIGDEPVLVGLPDTIWFPRDGLSSLREDALSFLLFPVDRPDLFDAVLLDEQSRVRAIEVKQPGDPSRWIWGAFKMPARVFRDLHRLWLSRSRRDEYLGTLVNAYIAEGGVAYGVRSGESYVDVGTLNGYRAALRLLEEARQSAQELTGLTISEPSGCLQTRAARENGL